MNEILQALLLTLLAGAATGAGGLLIIFGKKLSSNFLAGALGLSAGVMIFISLAELYPEAQAAIQGAAYSGINGRALVLASFFIGMGLIFLIDFVVPEYENPHEATGLSLNARTAATDMISASEKSADHNALKKLGIMSAIAIAIHNFPEGMATFVSAMENPQTGISIAAAVAIHNIPEGIMVAIPIYYATRKKGKAVGNAFLSGLAEPLGGVIGYLLLSNIFDKSLNGVVLAAVAGIMTYIALDELLPSAERFGHHHLSIIGVIAGMAVMAASIILI